MMVGSIPSLVLEKAEPERSMECTSSLGGGASKQREDQEKSRVSTKV